MPAYICRLTDEYRRILETTRFLFPSFPSLPRAAANQNVATSIFPKSLLPARPPLPESLRSRTRTTAGLERASTTWALPGRCCHRPLRQAAVGLHCSRAGATVATTVSERALPRRRVALSHCRAVVRPPSRAPLVSPTPPHGPLSRTLPGPLSRSLVHRRHPPAAAHR
jgi:hypothetical protein